MPKRYELPLLLFILLLAALARTHHLTLPSLWLDEGFTYHVIRQANMFPALLDNTSPPLYFLLLRGWTALAGDSVLALRFFSALPSLLSVAVVYRLAKVLGRGRLLTPTPALPREQGREQLRQVALVAALAALLLALSDADIFLAQEVRMYGWRKLFVVLSVWTYLRWARRPGTGRALWWLLTTAALPYIQYLGIYIPLIEGLHALLFLRGQRRWQAAGLLSVSGALFLPWFLGVTLEQMGTPPPFEMLNAPPSNLATLGDLINQYFTGQWALMIGLAGWGVVAAAEVGALRRGLKSPAKDEKSTEVDSIGTKEEASSGNRLGFKTPARNPLLKPTRADVRHGAGLRMDNSPFSGLSKLARGFEPLATGARSRPNWQMPGSTFLLVAWLVIPVGLTFLANLWTPLLMPRNLDLITPAIAILVARGLGGLRNPARGLLVAAIVVYGLATVDFTLVKPPWNVVGANAARYAVPGEVALMEMGNGGYPLGYYLDHWLPAGTPVRSLPLWREASGDAYNGELLALLAGRPTVWLAAWGDDLLIFRQLTDMGYTRTATMTTDHLGNALNVYRYDALPARAAPLAAFTSGMVLRAARIYPDLGRIDLWWSAEATPDRDYTLSAFLLDSSGRLVAQRDSYPFEDARPTSGWGPGEVVYDPRSLEVSAVPPGTYTVGVKLYTWQDGAVYPTVDGEEYAVVGTFERQP